MCVVIFDAAWCGVPCTTGSYRHAGLSLPAPPSPKPLSDYPMVASTVDTPSIESASLLLYQARKQRRTQHIQSNTPDSSSSLYNSNDSTYPLLFNDVNDKVVFTATCTVATITEILHHIYAKLRHQNETEVARRLERKTACVVSKTSSSSGLLPELIV